MLARCGSLALLVLVGCSPSTPPAGSVRGPCYGNGTCDAPLTCLSDICVSAAVDGGTDAPALVDTMPPPHVDAGPAERRTYVVSELAVPATSTEARADGVDLDGDAVVDNALGNTLAALAASTSIDFGGLATEQVDDGSLLVLVDLRAPSFTSGSIEGNVPEGTNPTPAPCATPGDPLSCRMHLSGSGHFDVVTPAPTLLGGTIGGASFRLVGTSGMLPIPFTTPPLWVPAVAIDVRADVGATGLSSGTLAGAIRATDVQALVVPALHTRITDVIARDCPTSTTCASGSSGEQLLMAFDGDEDGTVTIDEFRSNGLIAAVLMPDLDLFDGTGAIGSDGTPDAFSVGFGFTAVGATFDAP